MVKKKNFLKTFFVFSLALIFVFSAGKAMAAALNFTADTLLDLTGTTNQWYIASGSSCDLLTVSGSSLTSTIPDGSLFALKTSLHDIISAQPSGGDIVLSIDTSNATDDYLYQWTASSTVSTTQVNFVVGMPKANTWYQVNVDGSYLGSYESNDEGAVSFTYDKGFSTKVFTISQDTTAPNKFSLVFPANNAKITNTKLKFEWNPSTSPDLNHYDLYIDNAPFIKDIKGTSIKPISKLKCGKHTWRVRAYDNAGNYTDSETFNLDIICGGGVFLPPAKPKAPKPSPGNPEGGFNILINDGAKVTHSRQVTLKLYAGPDVKRMALSEDDPTFAHSSQERYVFKKEWTLSPKSGKHTIYVKFYTEKGGVSPIVFDSIIYQPNSEKNSSAANNNASSSENNNNNNEQGFIFAKVSLKPGHFAYGKARLGSLAEEQRLAVELKQELEKYFGKGKIPISAKNWHTVVNSYIYGGYPVQAIVQAIRFGGKTVHPTIPFVAWRHAKDYLNYIRRDWHFKF